MFIALGFGGLLVGLVYNFQLVPAIIPWWTLLPSSFKVLTVSQKQYLFLLLLFFLTHSRMHSLSFQKVADLIPAPTPFPPQNFKFFGFFFPLAQGTGLKSMVFLVHCVCV